MFPTCFVRLALTFYRLYRTCAIERHTFSPFVQSDFESEKFKE